MKKIILILFVCASSAFAASPSFGPGGQWTSGTFSAATLTGTTSAATLNVSGSTSANGNTTLGDASGDTLTINAGTVTAPNASGTSSTSIANIGTTDARYPVIYNSVLASDFIVTSSTVFADTGISASGPAGTYRISMGVSGCESATGGFKTQIVSSSTFNVAGGRMDQRNGTTALCNTEFGAYTTLPVVNPATPAQYSVHSFEGTITLAASATIKVQFAQQTSSATASKAYKNSYLVLWKLP